MYCIIRLLLPWVQYELMLTVSHHHEHSNIMLISQVQAQGWRGCSQWSWRGWGPCTPAWVSTRQSSPLSPTWSYQMVSREITANTHYSCLLIFSAAQFGARLAGGHPWRASWSGPWELRGVYNLDCVKCPVTRKYQRWLFIKTEISSET